MRKFLKLKKLYLILVALLFCSSANKASVYLFNGDEDDWVFDNVPADSFVQSWLDMRVFAFFMGETDIIGTILTSDGAMGWGRTDVFTNERIDDYCQRYWQLNEFEKGWKITNIRCFDRETREHWHETIVVNDPDKIINY